MIPQLEQWIADAWTSLAPQQRQPRQLHIAKFSLQDYPSPSAAMLFMAFADHGSELVAVAKVARIPEGDATVLHEAQMLEQVRTRLPAEFLDLLPRPVRVGRLNERAALLMNALAGKVEMHHTWDVHMASRSKPQIDAALEWIDRMAMATSEGTCCAGEWLGGTPQEAVQALANLGCSSTALHLIEPRLEELWLTSWPSGLAHGDYFPGNILFGRGEAGRSRWCDVAVVDWMLAELRAPAFFDPLLYELSFLAQALYVGGSLDSEAVRAVHGMPPFADLRRRWLQRGIDIGICSPARLATLVHATLRDASIDQARTVIARSWMKLLEIEVGMPRETAAQAPPPS